LFRLTCGLSRCRSLSILSDLIVLGGSVAGGAGFFNARPFTIIVALPVAVFVLLVDVSIMTGIYVIAVTRDESAPVLATAADHRAIIGLSDAPGCTARIRVSLCLYPIVATLHVG
jgi:hypothetical protein